MLVHEFDNLMEAEPFRPFQVFTAGGQSIRVSNRTHAWHEPTGRTVFIAGTVDGKPRVHIVDLHLITRFDVLMDETASGNGRPDQPKTN